MQPGSSYGKCPELGLGEMLEPWLRKSMRWGEGSVLGSGLLKPPLLLLNHARSVLAA